MRRVRYVVLLCAAAGLVPAVASAQERVQYNINSRLSGELATRPIEDGRFNGRLWIGRPVIGGVAHDHSHGWRSPGPADYGASEHDSSTVYAKVGAVVSSFSAWETVQGRGNRALEAARHKWLDERSYTGGVRTHVNDLYLVHAVPVDADHVADAAPKEAVEPRATIHMPVDQPRFKSRMRVHAGDGVTRVIASTAKR